jgi:rubrerythrin
MDVVWFGLLVVGVVLLGMLAGDGRSREDIRSRRRWDATFEQESRRTSHTDATGMLLCRSCGTSASERAGRCPCCRAML